MKKERIASFDFIRGLCALLIVLYHTVGVFQLNPVWDNFPIKAENPAGNWSISIVAVFFMISGASLYYNYPKIERAGLIPFYFKRWKSLFPAFFLVWFINYIGGVVSHHNFFFNADPKYMILSFFGLDGYFYYLHPNYYSVGEWFLGAIVLLYALYPLLLFLFNRIKWIITAILGVIFVLIMLFNPFVIEKSQNLLVCMFSFWLGMLYIRYREQLKKHSWIGLLCIVPYILFEFVPMPFDHDLAMKIASVPLFLFLDWLSDYLFKAPPVKSFFLFSSAISYEIFLVHHVLISKYINLVSTNGTYLMNFMDELLITLLIFLITFLYAKALSLLIKAFVGTKLWKKIEGVFVKQTT